MTTEITLPPLPMALDTPLIANHARTYARAALQGEPHE